MQFDQALDTFVVECRDLLEAMETTLLALDLAATEPEQINAIFRTAHTIKGSAGLFGLDHVVSFTHVLESVLDQVRDGTVIIDEALRSLLLCCGDHIGAMIDRIDAGHTEEDDTLSLAGAPLLDQLGSFLAPAATGSPPTGTAFGHTALSPGAAPASGHPAAASAAPPRWHIALRFGPDVLRNGMDPLSFIHYLGTLGRVDHIVTHTDSIPAAEAMDPETCYLGFDIDFSSAADRTTIENVFEFVRDDASIQIDGGVAMSPVADAEPGRPKTAPEGRVHEHASIRVEADKVDHLINRVGELIIVAASANLLARRAGLTELQDIAASLATLVEEVRDGALQLRMVKIGATFNRFQRVVHDMARELGKDIQLVVRGEDTELDKTVVERISDPLTHLVRNAMDHGLADPAYRIARGKPGQGTITLNAYHDSGSVVIEVSDDGRGLDRERIRAKAVERGLVEADRTLSDAEIFNLIFEPGFSTAEQVTNLSGRGVGMDVVKQNITALRGTVGIESTAGLGTTVRIRLPLTLAIIDGFLVGVGNAGFVVPLDMIEECVELPDARDQDFIDLRGAVLPLVRLREFLGVAGQSSKRPSVVVVRHAGRKVGLVVDTLHGEFQTVIKPLGKMFRKARCISGSTILGSGEVGLILDIPALMQHAAQQDSLSLAAHPTTHTVLD